MNPIQTKSNAANVATVTANDELATSGPVSAPKSEIRIGPLN